MYANIIAKSFVIPETYIRYLTIDMLRVYVKHFTCIILFNMTQNWKTWLLLLNPIEKESGPTKLSMSMFFQVD